MFKVSNWLHLRIPFSFYLLPVFLFSLPFAKDMDASRFFLVFIVLHFFVYPSSNGYNSYYDRDEESIGGLKHPPKVTKGLYYLSLLFLFIALVLGFLVSWAFSSMVLVYSLVSMAYSYPGIRIKKYPYLSWFIAGFFQGLFTLVMAYAGISGNNWASFLDQKVLIPGFLTSLLLWSAYPLSQVYQHREDSRRGDQTLSLRLGVVGTFTFSSIWFLISGIAFTWYFLVYRDQLSALWGFLGAMAPVMVYFVIWFYFILKDSGRFSSYDWTMWMNRISAISLNIFFFWYFFKTGEGW